MEMAWLTMVPIACGVSGMRRKIALSCNVAAVLTRMGKTVTLAKSIQKRGETRISRVRPAFSLPGISRQAEGREAENKNGGKKVNEKNEKNGIMENFDKIFQTATRGGNNSHSRLFLKIHLPLIVSGEAMKFEEEEMSKIFGIPINHPGYIPFGSRRDFSKFSSIYKYLHDRSGYLSLACWDRDWDRPSSCWTDFRDAKFVAQPSNAPDFSPVFWAVVAAAQMYYGE